VFQKFYGFISGGMHSLRGPKADTQGYKQNAAGYNAKLTVAADGFAIF
jgi:hypothetical protein